MGKTKVTGWYFSQMLNVMSLVTSISKSKPTEADRGRVAPSAVSTTVTATEPGPVERRLFRPNCGKEFCSSRDEASCWGAGQRLVGTGDRPPARSKNGNLMGNDEMDGQVLFHQAAGAMKDATGEAPDVAGDTLHG